MPCCASARSTVVVMIGTGSPSTSRIPSPIARLRPVQNTPNTLSFRAETPPSASPAQTISDDTPRVGAIAVFWRGRPDSWTGHVGFVVGETASHIVLLGGNQSNAVNVMKIKRKRFLGARWPLTAGEPPGLTVAGADDVQASDGNEA